MRNKDTLAAVKEVKQIIFDTKKDALIEATRKARENVVGLENELRRMISDRCGDALSAQIEFAAALFQTWPKEKQEQTTQILYSDYHEPNEKDHQ